jgi:hypothetical protein
MIYETERGLHLKTSVEDVTHGQGFIDLVKAFEHVSMNRPEGFAELSTFMREKFGVNAKFSVIPSASEYKFYGFRGFPAAMQLNKNTMLDWGSISDWIIELDDKLVHDYSKRINPKDMAVLFLYWIENNLSNLSLIQRVVMIEKEVFCEGKVDESIIEFLYGDKPNVHAAKIVAIPRLYRCFWVNFNTRLRNESMLTSYLEASYMSAVNKLIGAYGTFGLINRKIEEFDSAVRGIVYWVFESVNDLKYSTFRFKKNLKTHMVGCTSPTAIKYMKQVYAGFTSEVTHVFAEESAIFDALHPRPKTPERIALEEANIEQYWKRQLKIAQESTDFKYIDDKGFAKPVDARELDEIRVGIQDIDSVEDKVFLLERLHEQLGRLDNALSMLEDKKLAHKVKQTKSELLKKRDDMELIRQLIFKAPVGKMRYGLFIKYPQGYEG